MDHFEYLPELKSNNVVYGSYDPSLPLPRAKYNVTKDGRWLAVIYQDTILGKKRIIDIGTENTRKAIKVWINKYLNQQTYLLPENERGKQTPDAYDRSKMN